MPMIPNRPDDGTFDRAPTVAPVEHGGAWDTAWTWVSDILGTVPTGAWWALASTVITVGMISSTRLALGKHNPRRLKSDKFLTFLAAAVATAVVATGMWKFFGDVLHIANPYARVALFAFFEIAMLASAFRSRRFRLDRASRRQADPGHVDTRIDVDGIAVWVLATLSGLFAAADESTTAGKLVRVVAPLLAAWMWERGLAGELMQFTRSTKGLNLRVTPERVLVWLGIAEPSGREVGEVDRKRRVAQFARTAYRLNMLTEQERAGWRVSWTRWRLRRLTEAANEHLKLATDQVLLGEVRAQLALLYGVEGGTSRAAVADLHPLAPVERLAIADRPFAPSSQEDSQGHSQRALRLLPERFAKASARRSHQASRTSRMLLRKVIVSENLPANPSESTPANPAATAAAKPARAARKPIPAATEDGPESVRKLAVAYSRKPGGTNAELAKLAKVSLGSANRHLPKIRAAANGSANSDDSQERSQAALIPVRIDHPKPLVSHGMNGSYFPTSEETR